MLEDFFHLDMLLEVLDTEGELLFVGQVTDIKGGTIELSASDGSNVPIGVFGDTIGMRGFLLGMRPMVATGQISGSTPQFWRVDHIQGSFTEEHRASFRQRVSVDTTLIPINDVFGQGEDVPIAGHTPIPCRVLDVSVGGMLFSCSKHLEVGDWVFLPEVTVVPEVPPFSFTCHILRQSENRTGFLYGCRLEGLTVKEEDALLRAIFKAQYHELKRRRRS